MYANENLVFLRKHYHELRKKENVKELHHLVNFKFNYLIAMDEDDKEFDVGKNNLLDSFLEKLPNHGNRDSHVNTFPLL